MCFAVMSDRRPPFLTAFWERLGQAERKILLLDYDGTLAPFRKNRMEAEPYPGVREALAKIQRAGETRLAFISGRNAAEVAELLRLPEPPEVWGSHGWERLRLDGTLEKLGPDGVTQAALDAIAAALTAGGPVNLEIKTGCMALHWRGMGQEAARELMARARRALEAFPAADVEQISFDGGTEFRAAGRNKGSVAREIVRDGGTAAAVAFLGDDMTDEDAFAALGEQDLTALVRPERRPTAARVWLRPPAELLDFLTQWEALARPRA